MFVGTGDQVTLFFENAGQGGHTGAADAEEVYMLRFISIQMLHLMREIS